ncbi:hypothetical protein AAFF_G00199500 [Aldrovandia affinis]|uniref:IMD domain-containing protein n=1 Tax=Aldrovandia affinis TaxID=143900 RepID=A0AAD7RIE2_9TELE|nr:hypothetical protein AAFF_G00199500 [Aldrovandia affinis]
MVLPGASKMSRTDEVHRITENVYKSIMEQFNPCLRNFITMGKSYEKALSTRSSGGQAGGDPRRVPVGRGARNARSGKRCAAQREGHGARGDPQANVRSGKRCAAQSEEHGARGPTG